MPVVAAMGGHAFGGGLELALACDLRVCASRARLGMPPARLGVVYSPSGLRRFVDAIGVARTRELFLTARPVGADEALAWGLVNEVVEDVPARSVALASEIAALAPLSLRGNKRVLRALDPPTRWTPSSRRCATPRSARRTLRKGCGRSSRSARRSGAGV